ncbi:hypothetical protein N658DRAFT_506172 [Parathielavia hyrcaniae]|uniref:Heterokaryon incompatibility domain-containing protein n=1 Tax=Parathielavia hyrcaniae TaxID=113614 RepID=A0AAN6T3B4_9PEZI|nr:hypothetical protein N658DRAFT_506172 [Parathielavia hyrcaniae]
MADIYRKCEDCLIWLGDMQDEALDSFEELLNALSKKHHLDQPDAPRVNGMFGLTGIPLMFLNDVAWWDRIWVVQEVVLAPQSLVVFGPLEIPFHDLVRAVEFLDEHDVGSGWNPSSHEKDDRCHCMDHMKITFIWSDLLALRDKVYRLVQVDRPRRPQSDADSSNASQGASSVAHGRAGSPDIVGVLLSVRNRHCTDTRDKIFGVLSLVQNWGPGWEPIKADYSKGVLHVFIELASQMLQSSEYGPKTLLLARGAESQPAELTGLPSWVPDWSRPGRAYDKHLLTIERQAAPPPSSLDNPSVSVFGPTIMLHHALPVAKIMATSTPGEPIHRTYGQATNREGYRRSTTMLDEWRTFAGVQNPVTSAGVLNRYLVSSEIPGTTDNTATPDEHATPEAHTMATESVSVSSIYARLMTDLERSHSTVDFMPQILNYLDGIRHFRSVLRQRMGPDEEVFNRTLLHGNTDTCIVRLRARAHKPSPPQAGSQSNSNMNEYPREDLCILRLFLIFCNAFVDPDRFLTRLNSVVLRQMEEAVEMMQIWRKRLLRTEDGLLGIGPELARPGDEVFVSRGSGRRLY